MLSQYKTESDIKLNFLTQMINLFSINIFYILDKNSELPINIVIEPIMYRYFKLEKVDEPIDKPALLMPHGIKSLHYKGFVVPSETYYHSS